MRARARRRVAQLSLGLAMILAGAGAGATGAIGGSGLQVPATTWVGQVVAQSSLEPIPGVRVSVAPVESPAGWNDVPATSQESEGVVADAEGRFAIEAPRGARLVLVADSYLDGFVELTSVHESDLGQLVLREELSFSGRLLQGGVPAGRAVVIAPVLPRPWLQTTADDAGRFRIGGIRSELFGGLVIVIDGIAQQLDLGHGLYPVDARHHDLGDVELLPRQRLSGRIVGPDGAPIEGAVVWLAPVVSPLVVLYPRVGVPPEENIPYPTTVSDPSGDFVLSLFVGTYTLGVVKRGYVPVRQRLAITDATTTDAGDIELGRGVVGAGRVVDDAGVPLAGARVQLVSPLPWPPRFDTWPSRLGEVVAPVEAVSDDNGCYRLETLPAGDEVGLRVALPGHVEVWLRFRVPVENRSETSSVCGGFADIELPRAGRITGVVVDQQQAPLQGVAIYWQRAQSSVVAGGPPVPVVLSAADGRFEIPGLRAGDYEVSTRKYGYLTETVGNLVVTMEQVTEAQVKLTEVGDVLPLQVQALDFRGVPRPDTQINASIQTNNRPTRTVSPEQLLTGADGRVLFEHAPVGVYSISGSGGAMSRIGWRGPFRLDSELPRVVLHTRPPTAPPAFVSGRLVGADGRGVSAALIYLKGIGGVTQAHQAITEAGGDFRFDSVPGGTYLLKATRRGMPEMLHRGEILAVAPGVDDLVVQVPAPSVVRGRIRGLQPGEALDSPVEASSEEVASSRLSLWVTATGAVEADGSFVIENLIPGEWTLRATTSAGRSVETSVVIERPSQTVEAILRFASGFTLTGTVIWRSAPPPEGRIWLSGPERTDSPVSFDPNGAFEVRDLVPGRYRISVAGTGLGSPVFEWVDIDADRHIEIRVRGGAVSGTVLDADTGEVIAGAHLSTNPWPTYAPHGHAQFHRTDRSGRFEIGPVAAGAWNFDFTMPGYASRPMKLEIGDEDINDLLVEMRRSPGLKLHFQTSQATLPEDLSAVWQDSATGEIHQTFVFPESSGTSDFQWDGIPLGRGTLTVTSDSARAPAAARVEVTNRGQVVDVQLRAAGRLLVRVPVLATGPSKATMRLFDTSGAVVVTFFGQSHWESDEKGLIRTRALVAGTYAAEIHAEDGRSWSQQIEVRARRRNEIVLR